MFCTECGDEISVHADGTAMCSCESLDFEEGPNGTSRIQVQATWPNLSGDEADKIANSMRHEFLAPGW